jgi:hypothetical protein
MSPFEAPESLSKSAVTEKTLLAIAEAIRDLDFGQVVVTVHGGRAVQLDRTERTRLQQRDYHEQGSGI